ncbi:hypothetical protein Tco_0034095 [Tanacetum coccineum]
MLGIPMGSRKLKDLEQRPSNDPFIKEWENQFKHVKKPTPAAIASVISDSTQADFMFRMNFITLFGSSMGTLDNGGRELFNDNEFKLYEYSKDDDSEGETDGDNEDNNHDDDGAPTADANKKKERTDESGSEGTEENGSEATEGGSDGKEENMNGDEKEVTAHMDVDSQNKDLNKEKDANETEDNDKMNNIDMKNISSEKTG